MTAGFVAGWEPRVYTRDELVAKLARERADAPTVPDAYLGWTPWTDTVEILIPSFQRGLPLTEQPTAELHLLDLPPAPPAVRRPTPSPARRRLVSREDLTGAWNSALTVVGGMAAGFTVLVLIHAAKPLGELLLAASTGGH